MYLFIHRGRQFLLGLYCVVNEKTDSEVMEIPEGWDYTESEDYERLAKILCERNGCFFDENNWKN